MVAPSRYDRDRDLARPFPLRRAARKWRPDKRRAPKTQQLTNGLLSVAPLGCGCGAALVVTGACAGQVWHDDRAGDGKLCPDAPDFAAWYTKQMHDGLRQVSWGELSEATRTTPYAMAQHHEILDRRAAICDELTDSLGGIEGHLRLPLYQGQHALAKQRLHSIEAPGQMIQPWLRQRVY